MMDSYGLKVSGENVKVPLVSIGVEATIQGFIANVEHTLTYRNTRDNPIEATFTFPLDECSAIYKFEAEVEDRLIVGECQEKEEARETYQDAIAAGQSAFLLEENTDLGDIFRCSVGNLPPKTDAVIRFAYAIELAVQPDHSVRFVLPAVLSPRYNPMPSNSSTGFGQTQPTPQKNRTLSSYVEGKDVPYTFSFKLCVVGEQPVQAIHAEDKTIKLKYTAAKQQVELGSKFKFDRDLVLSIIYTGTLSIHAVVEMGDPNRMGLLKENMVMLNFSPKLENIPSEKGEYVFIVDRSGSMTMDNRIENASKALKLFLDNLPQDCYFNVVSFGSGYSMLFPKSQLKTAASLAKARKLQKELQANMGGTQILDALKAVLTQPAVTGYPQQIFLLTDGEVGNTAEVIQLVKSYADGSGKKHVRVFSFGIGHGASTALVKGIARVGKGKASFVTDAKKLPDIVQATLLASMQPAVTDLTLKWSDDLTAKHGELSALFVGDRLIVYAVVKREKKPRLPVSDVTLYGKVGSQELSVGIVFRVTGQPSDSAPIHRLCAKSMIKNLQDEEGYTEKHKAAIVLLSTAANIISRHTSYVGVDRERQDKVMGDMETVDVPLAHLKAGKKVKRGAKRKSASSTQTKGKKYMRFSMPALAPPRPTSYGGGSADAPSAAKYIAGKTPQLPPESSILAKMTSTSDAAPTVTTATVLDPSKCPDQDSPTSQLDNHTSEETEQKDNKSHTICGKKQLRRSVRCGKRFSHRKTHSPRVQTGDVLYGQWRDGHFYPAQILTKLGCNNNGNKFEVKFKDGVVRRLPADQIVPASYLSPGDMIALHNHKGVYNRGILLEYDADVDAFIIGRLNGQIVWLRADQLILPKLTGRQLRTRNHARLDAMRLCWYPDPISTDALCLSTTDLAELNPVGWINENIVKLFIRHLITTKLSEGEKRVSHIFDPEFFSILSQGIDTMTTRAKQQASQLDRLACRKTDVDLLDKDILFVPIFEVTHWYLIVVHLTHCCESTEQPSNKTIRVKFTIMDSYFVSERREEIKLLSGFLSMLCEEAKVAVQFVEGVTSAAVPIQENESDCGICTLQCIEQTFKDDLDPKPTLTWFTSASLLMKRRELSKLIMGLWAKQNK